MSETNPIRVLLVDDHAMLRKGLRFFLAGFDDLELVGEAASAKEAIRLCAELEPDVVLMDMIMPDMDGAAATQIIREQTPGPKVIALTSFQEEDLIERALEAGAISYLLKNVSAQALAEAIRQAHAGHSTLAPEATEVLIKATRQRTSQHKYGLTEREQEVLSLLVEGLSNAEIADRLVVSVATVKFHVRGILSKLGVSSRTEAVALAWQQNLVS
ncbi:MAG: response regulator [Anaerolineae bacterium]|jgi:NarL family two-component system response regulator LiaR